MTVAVINTLFALADMRLHVTAAAVVMMLGVALMGWLQSSAAPARDRIGIPLVAFLCGPTIASIWFAVDALWISPHSYEHLGDYLGTLLPMVLIGLAAGSVGAGAFWLLQLLGVFGVGFSPIGVGITAGSLALSALCLKSAFS